MNVDRFARTWFLQIDLDNVDFPAIGTVLGNLVYIPNELAVSYADKVHDFNFQGKSRS